MNYKIYYLNFQTPVHIGEGNVWDTSYTFHADTIFSALCIEALKKGGEDVLNQLVQGAKENRLLISDAMPHMKKELWIRKPIIRIQSESDGDSIKKKSFKKLNFIPLLQLQRYIDGNLEPEELNKRFKKLGQGEVVTKATMCEREDETVPYNVGLYRFAPDNGLYILAGYASSIEERLLDELVTGLGYVGLGGKVSSGMGKFNVQEEAIDEKNIKISKERGIFISLSIALPKELELEESLRGAQYKLLKRSGFVSSNTYSKSPHKKKDIYMIQSGSGFERRFEGDIYDVSINGSHPVYRYGKPMFVEV